MRTWVIKNLLAFQGMHPYCGHFIVGLCLQQGWSTTSHWPNLILVSGLKGFRKTFAASVVIWRLTVCNSHSWWSDSHVIGNSVRRWKLLPEYLKSSLKVISNINYNSALFLWWAVVASSTWLAAEILEYFSIPLQLAMDLVELQNTQRWIFLVIRLGS